MTLRLHTPLAEHFSDIAEVLHVFYPGAEVAHGTPDACDVLHACEAWDGWVTDTFTTVGIPGGTPFMARNLRLHATADESASFRWTTRIQGDSWEQKRRRKRGLKLCCYYLLRRLTGIEPPWGSLTGIRPTRLFYERLSRGDRMDQAREALIRMFDLREDRAQLLMDTVSSQRGLIDAPANAVDIYVGIPFCATRCAYCSFFAEAVGNGKKVEPYLAALFRELDATAAVVRHASLAPRALYIGGGTPTALSADQLTRLLDRMRALFPQVREWTVEAGRPDTIDAAKLAAMRDAGVTRLSVNPQTMNDETLRVIGRAHTERDVRDAFELARNMGFQNINMDVIAALPGETARDFRRTLAGIEALGPDSLTVHTLARKHGSRLNEFGFEPVADDVAEEMVEMGAACAHRMGMRPYYLYRQKYVAGNLENVGYARPGKESLYNIDIMEETTSVLAVGAGAISKRVFPKEARIERAPNVGDVGHYMERVDEMIERKRRLWEV